MKKIASMLLCVCMLVAFCACGAQTPAIVHGSIDGEIYTNSFAGLTFKKPTGWVYATEQELTDTMSIAADLWDGDDLSKAFESTATVYDMMASNGETGNNVNIVFEDLKKSGSTGISVKKYLEAAQQNLNAQDGISYAMGDQTDVKLGKTTYTHVQGTINMLGQTFTQELYLKKQGNYMIIITFTCVEELTTEQIEACFS